MVMTVLISNTYLNFNWNWSYFLKNHSCPSWSRPLDFLHKKNYTFFISTVTGLPAVFTSNVPHDIDLSSLFWHTRNQNCCFNSFQILMLMYWQEIYSLVRNIKCYSSLEIKLVKIDFIFVFVSFNHATC